MDRDTAKIPRPFVVDLDDEASEFSQLVSAQLREIVRQNAMQLEQEIGAKFEAILAKAVTLARTDQTSPEAIVSACMTDFRAMLQSTAIVEQR